VFGNFIARLRTDPIRCDPRFLFWFLHVSYQTGTTEKFQKQTTGIRNLELKRFLSQRMLLPSLEEQRRIVALLDRAAEIRRRAVGARQKARAIIPALFRDMFGDPATNPKGWEKASLGDVTGFAGGTSLPEAAEFCGQEGGFLHCKVSTLTLPGNEHAVAYSVEWSEAYSSRAAIARPGSVIFPKRGAAIATNKKRLLSRYGILDPNLIAVLPRNDVLNSEFLLGWFETLRLEDITSGSTVPQLNKQDLRPLQIICPPLGLQAEYSERVRCFEALIKALDAAAAKAEALAAALSSELFGVGASDRRHAVGADQVIPPNRVAAD
jgi:type I restriction enzyme S subunit